MKWRTNKFLLDIKLIRDKIINFKDRFEYQKKWVNFNIKKGDKVLDVGCGGYPFPLANIYADLYTGKTIHRTEKLQKVAGKDVIVCDVEKMPFKDKEIDYVYCSHVLEHVNDPAKACDEIMRVGKRGYIETPTKTSDIMLNFLRLKQHKWFVVTSGNTLFFFEYDKKEKIDMSMNNFYEDLRDEFGNPFQDMFYKHQNLFDNFFQWNDIFYYYVFSNKGKLISTNTKQ